jgi:hypothetical protein
MCLYIMFLKVKKKDKKKKTDRKREKERDVNFYLNLLFIRFYFFIHSTDFVFFLFYNFYMQVFYYQHLLVFCTISKMTDILLSALTGMCFYYYVQLCLVLSVVCGTYWYCFVCCQRLLACCLTGLLSYLVAL